MAHTHHHEHGVHHQEHSGCCHGHGCCHEHGHEHEHHGNKKQLVLILTTVVLLVAAVWVEKRYQLSTWQLLLVYLIPYLLIGFDTLKEAAEGILHGDAFNEHFLMSVATIGALLIGFLPGAETQFPEAVFVMLFFQVGELFEGYAEGKSRDSIAHLMDIRPDVAHLLDEGGRTKEEGESTPNPSQREGDVKDVRPEEVEMGSIILIRPGEKIPLDGVVLEGSSALNTVALTGESMPRDITVGDEVISGCINLSGVIKVRTTKSFGESTVSKIISLVEHASEHKSKSEAFISKFARIYTPIVVFAAIALAILPPLLAAITISPFNFQFSIFNSQFSTWLYRALMFLVVSCPCALVISVPLTFFGGIGGASRKGILIKGANYMDILAKVKTVVFDKTGTLTHGQFAVEAVHPNQGESSCSNTAAADSHLSSLISHLLHLAAHVENHSTHPIAAALRDAFPEAAHDDCEVSNIKEIAGHGIQAQVGNDIVCVGNTKMMDSLGVAWHDCHHPGTIIHVAINGEYAGHIIINDMIKDDSAEAIRQLKTLGVERTVMLTGDRKEVADHVAKALDITEYHAELLPTDKVFFVEQELSAHSSSTSHPSYVAFVGDGINDAPVLARADVGIAMGGLGSDAAIEAADVVLMDDQPSKIAQAIHIARRTIAIARQNVWFAIGVKIAVLILATFGLSTMWMAVFADVGVTVLAVLNAMRTMY